MLHYERKLPALRGFEILSFNLCKKGAFLIKIKKSSGKINF